MLDSTTMSQEPLRDHDTGHIIHVKTGGEGKKWCLCGRISLTELCFKSNKKHCQNMRQPRLHHPAALSGSISLLPHHGGVTGNYFFPHNHLIHLSDLLLCRDVFKRKQTRCILLIASCILA